MIAPSKLNGTQLPRRTPRANASERLGFAYAPREALAAEWAVV